MAKKLYGAAKKAHARKAKRRKKNPTHRKAAAAPRRRVSRRRRTNPSTHRRRHRSIAAPVSGTRRRRHRRSNPSIGGVSVEKTAVALALAVAGGWLAKQAATMIESKVSQPPTILGGAEIIAAAAAMVLGAKYGQPIIGLGVAAGLGLQGAGNVYAGLSSSAGAGAPQVPAGASAPQVPQSATSDAQMQALIDADDADDMDGAEGMAAVFDPDDSDEASDDDELDDTGFNDEEFD